MANDDPMRIWQGQPVEGTTLSLDEIRRRAGRFESRIRNRNRREYIGAAAVAVAFSFYIFKFSDWAIRAGSLLVLAGPPMWWCNYTAGRIHRPCRANWG